MSEGSKPHKMYESTSFGTKVPYESISVPGCYVCNWNGDLLRAPEGVIDPESSPTIPPAGTDPLFVTRISNDPYVRVSKARLLAANCDIEVNF